MRSQVLSFANALRERTSARCGACSLTAAEKVSLVRNQERTEFSEEESKKRIADSNRKMSKRIDGGETGLAESTDGETERARSEQTKSCECASAE